MKPILVAAFAALFVPSLLAAQTPTPGITWSASTPTRVSPAEAAAILARHASIANRTGLGVYPTEGPLVISTQSDPTAGPYGAFVPFYLSMPDRRLDGSLWSDPLWMAGSPFWGWGSSFLGSGFVSGDGFSRLVLRGHQRGHERIAGPQRPAPGRAGSQQPSQTSTPAPNSITTPPLLRRRH